MPPARSERRVCVDGLDIYYVEAGQGKPVVLVHGYLVSHREWRHVIDLLAERFRVLALDLPGSGESSCPPAFSYEFVGFSGALAGFLQAVNARPAALMGHSMGAAVAMTTAVLHPGSVSRLVLVNALLYPQPLPPEARLALLPGIGEFLFKKMYREKDLRRYFETQVFADPSQVDQALVRYFWTRMKRPGGMEAAYRTLQAIADREPIVELPTRVSCPTLVVWGDRDRMIPSAFAQRLAREIPGAQLERMPSSAHSPIEDDPQEFVRRVTPFLEAES